MESTLRMWNSHVGCGLHFANCAHLLPGQRNSTQGRHRSSQLPELCRPKPNAVLSVSRAKEKLREGGAESIPATCIVCIAEALLAGIEFVTKFTVIAVAVTGDGFCAAAQRTFGLLRRNLLSSVTVDSVSVSVNKDRPFWNGWWD